MTESVEQKPLRSSQFQVDDELNAFNTPVSNTPEFKTLEFNASSFTIDATAATSTAAFRPYSTSVGTIGASQGTLGYQD